MGILGGGGTLGFIAALFAADVFLAVGIRNECLGGGGGLVGNAQAVGTHIGDQTGDALALDLHAFVQRLGGPHGAGGGEAQPTAGLLLHGGGDEGRRRHPAALALDQVGDHIVLALQLGQDALGLLAGFHRELFAPHRAMEPGGELFLAAGSRQHRVDVPVFLGLEGLDLLFPVHNQPNGHALHPSGGQAPAHLAPQKGAELIAHQPVQDTPGLLGVEEVAVDGAGMGHALGNALFGDLAEGDPVGVLDVQTQQMSQMPADGLSFPVRVGGEKDLVGLLGFAFQFLDELFFALDVDVAGGVAVFHINAQLALGQIPDMAHAGGDLVAIAQIFPDGFRLGRRLHDN